MQIPYTKEANSQAARCNSNAKHPHVHNYLTNALPDSLQEYYFKLNYLYLNVQKRNSNLGCFFIPSKNTTKYGLNSITQQCIYNWNSLTKELKPTY